MDKNQRIKQLIEKHKPMTKADIVQNFKEQAELKKGMTTNAAELEANLKKFNQIADPLINPETGEVMAWIRRPSTAEYEEMIPEALLEYRNDPNNVPPEIMKKHENFLFDMMANLISNPKKDASFWKENTNLVFQTLFNKHLTGVLEDLGISAENF